MEVKAYTLFVLLQSFQMGLITSITQSLVQPTLSHAYLQKDHLATLYSRPEA